MKRALPLGWTMPVSIVTPCLLNICFLSAFLSKLQISACALRWQ
jgi:hypothetical protein